MHKLYQKQLEEAIEQLEFPITTSLSNKYSSSFNNSNKLLYNKSNTILPNDWKERKRSQSVVQSSSDIMDVTSSLHALDILHEKLKMFSQENQLLKIQLEKSRQNHHHSISKDHNVVAGKMYEELDHENFILRKDKEELMERVEELERKIQEFDSKTEDRVGELEGNIDAEKEESNMMMDRLLEIDESNSNFEENMNNDDLLIIYDRGGEKYENLQNPITIDFSMQCSLVAEVTSIEKMDKETSTEEEMNERETNKDGDSFVDEVISKIDDEEPLKTLIENEKISLEIETSQSVSDLLEHVENLKKELEIKNEVINNLNKEKVQYERNEQDYQKAMTQLTAHVKALVRESVLLREEYNLSIQNLKEELIANKKNNCNE